MDSILHNLYHGDIVFDSFRYTDNSPYMQAVRKRQEAQDKLKGLLDDEGKAIFSQYEDAAADATDIARFDTFSEHVVYDIIKTSQKEKKL